MINIDPFLQRLEWLKEWMNTMIDHSPSVYYPGKHPRSMCGFGIAHPIRDSIGRITGYRKFGIHNFEQYCTYKQSTLK